MTEKFGILASVLKDRTKANVKQPVAHDNELISAVSSGDSIFFFSTCNFQIAAFYFNPVEIRDTYYTL